MSDTLLLYILAYVQTVVRSTTRIWSRAHTVLQLLDSAPFEFLLEEDWSQKQQHRLLLVKGVRCCTLMAWSNTSPCALKCKRPQSAALIPAFKPGFARVEPRLFQAFGYSLAEKTRSCGLTIDAMLRRGGGLSDGSGMSRTKHTLPEGSVS
eukprot:2231082-Pleurochrysis_carterae.AAC.2